MSQLNLLASPAAKALFQSNDLPERLQPLANQLRTAMEDDNFGRKAGKVLKNLVIWDSGASHSISPDRKDFVGDIRPAPLGLKIQGIARGLSIEGIGHVAWSFVDTTGMLRTVKVPAYLVPEANARLLSIPSLLQSYPDEHINMSSDKLIFSGTRGQQAREI